MSRVANIYIRLCDNAGEQIEWFSEAEESAPKIYRGSWQELAENLVSGSRMVVFAPSNSMVTLSAEIPPLTGKRLTQALPYALEESLAEDVEAMHIAAGVRNSEGRIPVVAVSTEQMLQWQQQWQQVSWQPHYLVNEALSLPWEKGQWSLLLEDDAAMLRSGEFDAFSLPRSQLNAMLELAAARHESDSIERLIIYDARSHETDTSLDLPATVTAEIQQEKVDAPVRVMAEGFSGKAINLLQGEFSRREQVGKFWRPWRMTAVLLLAVSALQIGMLGFRYWNLSTTDEQLYEEMKQVFRDTFPNVADASDPKNKMESKLAEFQGTGRGTFIELMEKSGQVIADTSNMQLQNLRYNKGSLELELVLDNLQLLDSLKSRLQEKGLQVDVLSASTGDEQVTSRIGLTVAGS